MKPVHIFIGGAPLEGYTRMSLSRQKADLTGSASIDLFFNYLPDKPVVAAAMAGAEVSIYIGGHLALVGTVDSREGGGGKGQARDAQGRFSGGSAGSRSVSISKDHYSVKISVRGKTKHLISSSHQHKTTNMLKPTNRQAVETLVGPYGIRLDWKSKVIKLDKVRFRDGAAVLEELHRIAVENGHFLYETRDGALRFTDGTGETAGEDLILGDNILTFSAEQSEANSMSEYTIKGQRTDKKVWGEEALLKTVKKIRDSTMKSHAPLTIQHYGDSTDEALERRGRYEANKRNAQAKTVTVEVFHVQSRTGEPWDIGNVHYVEIPTEGIFDVMECTGLEYSVENDDTLKTKLTLSPIPGDAGGGGNAGLPSGLLSFAPFLLQQATRGAARRAATGITLVPGQYPAVWAGPSFSNVTIDAASAAVTAVAGLATFATSPPPLKLPAPFESDE